MMLAIYRSAHDKWCEVYHAERKREIEEEEEEQKKKKMQGNQ